MRKRLLLSTLAAVSAAVVLLGAPLAVVAQRLLTTQALDKLQQLAEGGEIVLDQATARDAELVMLLLSERTGVRITLLTREGQVVLDSGNAPEGAVAAGPDVARAVEGGVGRARGDGSLAVAVPAERAGVEVILRATVGDEGLRSSVRRAWLALVGLALVALGVAALLARWQGRRFAAPLEDLAASARRLGEGDFSARAPRSGLPELDDVAGALDRTALRLGAMLERSGSFSADASHQLRTPLTALRLHLEALEATVDEGQPPDGTGSLVSAAVVEADRLEATIDELLALSAAPPGTERIDVAELVAARLDAWQALARAQDRRVVVQQATAPPVRAREAAIGQCLQVLLDNALQHGEGTITVVIEPVGGGVGRAQAGTRLCVDDEGPGFPPDVVERLEGPSAPTTDSGRGLTLARSLVEAEGGRLRLQRTGSGTMACLLLPAASAVDSSE